MGNAINVQDVTGEFGRNARSLSRNPLGLIALFVVLVYGLAIALLSFRALAADVDRLLIVSFVITFPFAVLWVFFTLVSRHSANLYGPSDFSDQRHYYELQILGAASLTAAALRLKPDRSDADTASLVEGVVESLARAPKLLRGRQRRVLWVDDNPSNNTLIVQAFEAAGVRVETALTTAEALEKMERVRFDAVISDMGRQEGNEEGYVLLAEIRRTDASVPYYIFAGSNLEEHRRMAKERGANGSTNSAEELYSWVMKSIT